MIFEFKILPIIYFIIYWTFCLCSPLFGEISFTALILYFRLSSFPYWTLWKFWNSSIFVTHIWFPHFLAIILPSQWAFFSVIYSCICLDKKLSVAANYCVSLLLLFHVLVCLQHIRGEYQSRLIDNTSFQSLFSLNLRHI